MQQNGLLESEQKILLRSARQAMESAVRTGKHIKADPASLTPRLKEYGASFVTLTMRGELRGCIGALEAHQPLVEDVIEHAIASALEDPRFPPVSEGELSGIRIEISRLTDPLPLEYSSAQDLIQKLRPHVDGVILRDGSRRATFLPQVWEKIPDPEEFLDDLCYKMGIAPKTWKKKHLDVLVYQVQEFSE